MAYKTCSQCKLELPCTAFNKRADGPGYRHGCKACAKLKYKQTYVVKRVKRTAEQIKSSKVAALHKFRQKPEYKAAHAARQAERRARKLNATPKWLNAKQLDHIKFYYACAKFFGAQFAQAMHVDHIIPLNSDTVCGLHVPWNLQLMVAEANCRKGNKYETRS